MKNILSFWDFSVIQKEYDLTDEETNSMMKSYMEDLNFAELMEGAIKSYLLYYCTFLILNEVIYQSKRKIKKR